MLAVLHWLEHILKERRALLFCLRPKLKPSMSRLVKSPFPGYKEAEAVLSLGAEYLPLPSQTKDIISLFMSFDYKGSKCNRFDTKQ